MRHTRSRCKRVREEEERKDSPDTGSPPSPAKRRSWARPHDDILKHARKELAEFPGALFLAGKSIRDEDAGPLAEVLARNNKLRRVTLHGGQIGGEAATTLAVALLLSTTSLRTLSFRNVSLHREGATKIGHALGQNRTLNRLELARCAIDADGIEAIAKAVASHSTLQNLDVSGNAFGDAGIASLAHALEVGVTGCLLRTLVVGECDIGPDGATALGTALSYNGTLERLDIDNNHFGDDGAAGLAVAFSSPKVRLQHLCLENNSIGAAGMTAIALHIPQSLDYLMMDENPVGDGGAVAIAEAMKKGASLLGLYVSGCGIGDRGAQAFAKALETNPSLAEITLDANLIRNPGAAALGRALAKNTTLTDISMETNNLIAAEGVRAFASGVAVNTKLRSIDIGGLQCGDAGAEAVAAALAAHPSIEHVGMPGSLITDVGAIAMASALCTNQKLHMMDLRHNAIGDKGAEDLAEALTTANTALQGLILCGNDIKDAGARSVINAYSAHPTLSCVDVDENDMDEALVDEIEALNRERERRHIS